MELPQFREAVSDTTALLKALRTLFPTRVDDKLLLYLERLQQDDVGLELLRDAIKPKG